MKINTALNVVYYVNNIAWGFLTGVLWWKGKTETALLLGGCIASMLIIGGLLELVAARRP